MARRPNDAPLYSVFGRFLDLCIKNDKSLLWPERQAWTKDKVTDIKAWMVDSPIWGDSLSFEEKLKKQMDKASPEHWAVICDTFYVYPAVA